MLSVKTNSTTQGRLNISDVGLKVGSTKLVAATVRGALTLTVLSALLLIAARPAQAEPQSVLYSFAGNPDGSNPNSSLTFNGGNIYGTTYSGGLGYGTVFELSPNGSGGWTETVIYSFTGEPDGANPNYSYVIFDTSGNLYGTTYAGGANGDGTVFELSPPAESGGAWTETVLYSFCSATNCADGENPVSGLVMDSSGNLYGTTWTGGAGTGTSNGAVFELSLSGSTWTEQVIDNINSTYSGLTMNSAGDIFGAGYGAIFELTPNGSGGWNPKAIYAFDSADSATEGLNPDGALVFDSAGNIYGTMYSGGADKDGLVYKLTLGKTGTYTRSTLYTFDTEGTNPFGGVVLDASGNLYGTASNGGGHDFGDVFELVAPTTKGAKYTFRLLYVFTGETGNESEASLTLNGGYLYGTTYLGGTNGVGEVFAVNPNGTATTTVLTSSSNPSTEGTAVTFTATVTPAPPDGEVVVFEPLAQSPMTGGVATYTTSTLPVGTTKVRAAYQGDLNFIGSDSAWLPQVVKK
jgi:uncharacterized repeat protein (TIGR03803 family)